MLLKTRRNNNSILMACQKVALVVCVASGKNRWGRLGGGDEFAISFHAALFRINIDMVQLG